MKMVYIKFYDFSFSVFHLLLILINLNFYLLYNTIEAASIPSFQSYSDATESVCQNKCTTPACRDFEERLGKYMNTAIDPCDDFYEFTCGNFKNHFSTYSKTDTMHQMSETSVRELLFELNQGFKYRDTAAIRKLKIYYQNCLNRTRIEEEGDEMLLNVLNKIGGWPVLLGDKWNESDYDVMNTIYKMMDENLTLFFPIQLNVKETHYKKKILSIDGPSTEINDFFYLKNGSANAEKILTYFNLMGDVALSLGANISVAFEELYHVLAFEKSLHEIQQPNQGEFINVHTIKDFPRTKFNISWFEMIMKEIGTHVEFGQSDEVYLASKDYFEKLDELLNNTSKKVVANYLAWHFIRTSLRYQPKYLVQLNAEYTKNVAGVTFPPVYSCYNDMRVTLQHGLSALFARMSYDPYVNDDIPNLFQSIKEQFKINLQKIDWMDEETRRLALRKVDKMTVELPYPNKLLGDEIDKYYENLEINPGSYFESFLNVSLFNKKKKFEGLYEEYNASSWIVVKDAVEANGFYRYFFNQMTLSAGFLRSPLYHPDRPQYLNYGGAGTIIGHEITHGFDANGRYYDESGNNRDWWKPETENKFLEKVDCLINQYNNFILNQTGQFVDGVRTQNENIADNGGFKIAYYAYQAWMKSNNISEDCLSSLNYTPQQLFWISAANNWCVAMRDAVAENQMLTDVHSPSQARVINSFSNIKEFADDFQCRPGSRMNPEKKCIVW